MRFCSVHGCIRRTGTRVLADDGLVGADLDLALAAEGTVNDDDGLVVTLDSRGELGEGGNGGGGTASTTGGAAVLRGVSESSVGDGGALGNSSTLLVGGGSGRRQGEGRETEREDGGELHDVLGMCCVARRRKTRVT